MNLIAKKIVDTRKSKGLTQEELAEKANLNLRTIQRIENSENEPRGKTLKLICEVLEINLQEFNLSNKAPGVRNIGNLLINIFFLLVLNLTLMAIIGYLTLDSNSTINSRFGAYLISVFIPYFLVTVSQNMSGMERMLKFGTGYLCYFVLISFTHGFPIGFTSGLFPCLVISLSILYFGRVFLKAIE
ncbi:MAG: hypothetical protein COA80_11045 [Leeuwenhoekiella sp.]|nr:MAG: hypothetical protein COA80_11045 [Leeuwenhoekiella sp.]